jgi:hypothetical protein
MVEMVEEREAPLREGASSTMSSTLERVLNIRE